MLANEVSCVSSLCDARYTKRIKESASLRSILYLVATHVERQSLLHNPTTLSYQDLSIIPGLSLAIARVLAPAPVPVPILVPAPALALALALIRVRLAFSASNCLQQ